MTISLLGRHYEGIQLRPLTDIRQNDIAEWQALARVALEPNPFFEPEFVLPLAAAFPEDNARLLVVKGNSRWEACLPVVVRQPWRRLPIPVMTTWLTKYSFLGTPLVAAGGRDTLLQLLTGTYLVSSRLLELKMVAADGPVWALLKEALSHHAGRAIILDRAERAAVRGLNKGSYLTVPAKRLAEYRRQRKALERECGPLQFVDLTDDPLALDEFLSLEAAGWKGHNGTALASRAGHGEFFRKACHGLARTGRLQFLALVGHRTVAMQCNFVVNEAVFGFKTCYDEKLSKYSPGVLLQLDALAAFSERGMERFDSCTHASDSHLNRLLPDRQPLETVAIASPDLAGLVVMTGVSAAENVKHGVRKVLQALSLRSRS